MAIAFVQESSNTAGSGSTSVAVTLAGSPAAGNALVCMVTANASFVSGITGGGVTWVLLKRSAFSNYAAEIWYGENSSGSGTGITVTMTSGSRINAHVSEWSGIKTSSSADAVATATGTSTAPKAGSVTASAAPALYLGVLTTRTNENVSAGPDNSYTALTAPSPADSALRLNAAYKIVTAAPGALNVGWTLDASGPWEGSAGVLLGAGAADVSITLSPVVLTLYAPQGEGVSSSSGTGSYLRRRLLHRR